MAYQLQRLFDRQAPIVLEQLQKQIERLIHIERPRFQRLWTYYRNPMRPGGGGAGEDGGSSRPYRMAQEWGLPPRITGVQSGSDSLAARPLDGIRRKEVVVENDIGWRIDTMIDYLFGRSIAIHSTAADPQRRRQIEALLQHVLSQHGGITFLQQLALLGSVHGFADVLVKLQPGPSPAGPAPSEDDLPDTGGGEDPPHAQLQRIARCVRLEIVEPVRALPLLSPHDYRVVQAYVQCYELPAAADAPPGARRPPLPAGLLARALGRLRTPLRQRDAQTATAVVVEIITADAWQRYVNEQLVAEGRNALGEVPLVHIQNIPLPFEYGGASDVEPLIPLQDELNTRLSDRANRIALQSFKMYLGKGIEQFTSMPVAPGRMWMTDNEQAEVLEFGGDAGCPSEEAHISDLRDAMDKLSGVTPIAAGVTKGRIGRLTSGAALRITLMALLARTEKKRISYGTGIEQMCRLTLAWLDRAGLFATHPDERQVRIHWPSPLPDSELDRLQQAQIKHQLGVPQEVVLRELGYADAPAEPSTPAE